MCRMKLWECECYPIFDSVYVVLIPIFIWIECSIVSMNDFIHESNQFWINWKLYRSPHFSHFLALWCRIHTKQNVTSRIWGMSFINRLRLESVDRMKCTCIDIYYYTIGAMVRSIALTCYQHWPWSPAFCRWLFRLWSFSPIRECPSLRIGPLWIW